MLFHVTMTHSVDDCPGYNLEKMPEVIAGLDKLDATAKETNVKILFSVDAAPEHVAYALIEADSQAALLGFISSHPIRHDYFKVTPVMYTSDVVAFAKQLASKIG